MMSVLKNKTKNKTLNLYCLQTECMVLSLVLKGNDARNLGELSLFPLSFCLCSFSYMSASKSVVRRLQLLCLFNILCRELDPEFGVSRTLPRMAC